MSRVVQRVGSMTLLDAALQCNPCNDLSVQGICPMIPPVDDETLRRRATFLHINFFGRSVLKKDTDVPVWGKVRCNYQWLVTT